MNVAPGPDGSPGWAGSSPAGRLQAVAVVCVLAVAVLLAIGIASGAAAPSLFPAPSGRGADLTGGTSLYRLDLFTSGADPATAILLVVAGLLVVAPLGGAGRRVGNLARTVLWAVVGLGVLLAAGGAVRAWGAATLPAGAPIRDLLPQVLQAAATPAVSCLLAAVASVFAASVLRRVGGYRSR